MAQLDPARKKALKHALMTAPAPWVLCGVTRGEGGVESALDGVVGLVDWILHGQVSRMIQSGLLSPGQACLLPGDPVRGRPSFLLAPQNSTTANLLEKLRKLGVTEVVIAESTFPPDFRAKVKQAFKKEGIRCTPLEPEPNEPR
jgi:hypothetical protein